MYLTTWNSQLSRCFCRINYASSVSDLEDGEMIRTLTPRAPNTVNLPITGLSIMMNAASVSIILRRRHLGHTLSRVTFDFFA